MIKSTLNNDLSEVIAYPCLMVSTTYGRVVLFTRPMVGTVVNVGHSSDTIGEVGNNWTMDNFKPYRGEVILKG